VRDLVRLPRATLDFSASAEHAAIFAAPTDSS
jgi:hypothetical protein